GPAYLAYAGAATGAAGYGSGASSGRRPAYPRGPRERSPKRTGFSRAQKPSPSPPPTAAAARYVAGVATIEVIKARSDATAVPVAGDEPDAFACGPAETRRRQCREPRAVDDEIAAVRGLHDLDHVLLGRQREPVLIVPR